MVTILVVRAPGAEAGGDGTAAGETVFGVAVAVAAGGVGGGCEGEEEGGGEEGEEVHFLFLSFRSWLVVLVVWLVGEEDSEGLRLWGGNNWKGEGRCYYV